jgi:hypothetical protein
MKIQSTRDYSLFKRMEGNRVKSNPHIARLQQAIDEAPETIEFTPIIVNEKYEVIDGQHRLEALQNLNLPIYYLKVNGHGLATVQRLNSVSRTWSPVDYAKSFRELGNENYRIYLEFKSEFKLNHDILLSYLGLDKHITNHAFKEGKLEVGDEALSYRYCHQLKELSEFYDRLTLRQQATAMLNIMVSPSYDHKKMLNKFRQHAHRINEQKSVTDYAREFEKVYNFKSKLGETRLF